MSIEKFKTLPLEALAAGYDVLLPGSHYSLSHKAGKVMDILKGDVTPGVQAEEWHEFFQLLEASQPAQPISSPEEWLESQGIDTAGKTLAEIMQAYADHVAALVHRNTRHRAAEIVATEGGGNGTQCAQSNAKMYNAIMNIPLRAVYPAGEENREG